MSSGTQSTVHVIHTISGFTEHGMVEAWPILCEDKPERASSPQHKVVLPSSQTGVTFLASIVLYRWVLVQRPLSCVMLYFEV